MGALVFALLPVLVASFVTWRRLVRHEYTAHRTDWERDGRPVGMSWRPAEVGSLGPLSQLSVSWATHRAMLVLLFRTPAWAADDPLAVRLMRRLRLFVLIWNVGVITTFAVGLLLAG